MTKNFFVRTAAAGIAALVLCGSAVADTWRGFRGRSCP